MKKKYTKITKEVLGEVSSFGLDTRGVLPQWIQVSRKPHMLCGRAEAARDSQRQSEAARGCVVFSNLK